MDGGLFSTMSLALELAELPTEARLSRRDRLILAATRRHLEGTREDFAEAVRALTEAVAASIPNGRIYVLDRSPLLVGSLVSGVGITESPGGIVIERIDAGDRRRIERLWR